MKHVFIVTLPDGKPRQFILKGKRIGLGRGEENDICLEVNAVSSSHLEFRKTDEGYEVEDLGSTNGTRVNGKKIESAPLADGDRIMIGETVPAHFLLLAEGETWEASTDKETEKDHEAAAEFVSMSDRLVKLEANIEEKVEEAAKLETQLAELRDSYQKQLTDYGEAQLALEQLQEEIAQKRQQGGATPGEIKDLEDFLIEKTQKVQLMGSNLAAQKQQISQLEKQEPVIPPAKTVVPPAPALPQPLPPRQTLPQPQPAAPAANVPVPQGPKTVKLTKLPAAAPAPTLVKKKRP